MTIEKTTDWSAEKEAAAKNLPLSEKINPNLHKIAEGKKVAQKNKTVSPEDGGIAKS